MISIKIYKSYRNVVAACDSNLIGKKFEDGKFQLEAKESFYKGREINEKSAIREFKAQSYEDATFNILGSESINAAIKAGIIKKNNVSKIKGIPFALVLI